MKIIKCGACGAPLRYSKCEYCGTHHHHSTPSSVKLPVKQACFFEGREVTDPKELIKLQTLYGHLAMRQGQ